MPRTKPNRTARMLGLTLTTALATVTLAGCSAKVAPPASASAMEAQNALAKGKADKAVQYAESAVLAAPRDATLRALLGASYIEAGRFQSAATTLGEAVELGDNSGRTIVTLALAQIASGRPDIALQTLDAHETDLDPADFGLAVALAGQPQRGVLVLGNQLRFGENSAKVRQNLAYAYALQGDWRAARLMAAEDVPADRVGERMAHWGQMANPAYFRHRVADLLGVGFANDPGQPARLALGNHPSVNMLAAETIPDVAHDRAPVALAARGELPPVGAAAPVALRSMAAATTPGPASDVSTVPAPTLAPIPTASSRFTNREVSQPVPARTTPRSAPVMAAAPEKPVKAKFVAQSGDYRVQLGSYFSMSDAQQAWKVFQQRHPELAGAQKVITKANVKGKMYYRVAAAGYAEQSARSLCSLVKQGGGGCIAYAANNPLPGALESGVRMASR